MSEKRPLPDLDDATVARAPHPTISPGRFPASAKLFPGALLRKARDANGVAADADTAVARASSSTGAALPDDTRARFESSLGADLSGVRVHTGAASAEAASAVGARAYTVGNDIHFAAGQYAPADPFGVHLLAHEVAHTVQQAGAAPTPQYKLEVSAPSDPAELEADRAADAMVAGQPATVASTPAALARDYDNDLNKAAQEGEKRAHAAHNDQVLDVSTVKDRASAEQVLHMLEHWDGDLDQALETKDATVADITQNNRAKQKLEDYLGALDGEDLGLENFKTLYKRVQVDYARLDAMAQKAGAGLTDKNRISKSVGADAGKDLAKDHIDNAAGKNDATSDLAARANAIANTPGNDEIKAMMLALKQDKAPLDAQQKKVVTAERMTTTAVIGVNASGNQVKAVGASISSASLKRQFEKAKAEIAENQETVKQVCEVLTTAAEAILDPEKAAETIVKKAFEMFAPAIAKAMGLPGLSLSAEDEKKGQQSEIDGDKAAITAYAGAKQAYITAMSTARNQVSGFVAEVCALEEQKRAHRSQLLQLGAKLDAAEAKQPGAKKRKPGELGPFQTITAFLSEADAFIADAKVAKEVGRTELDESKEGSAANNLRANRSGAIDSMMVRIPSAYQDHDGAGQPTRRWIVASQTVGVHTGGAGSAADSGDVADGAGSVVQTACEAIDRFVVEISAYRDQLRAALDVA